MSTKIMETKLKRVISLPLTIFYGLGTIIGGGIYALTGKVAAEAGMHAPVSFAVAALLASITAFSYAELVARHPHSSGEAHYVHSAFGHESFTKLIGWLVVLVGVVSTAALSTAASGFLLDIVPFSKHFLTIIVVVALGGLAVWGISQSVIAVSIATLIEIGGLVFIVVSSGDAIQSLPQRWHELTPALNIDNLAVWSGIAGGAFIAFYAFIGFEDMVNIAEEVKNVRRNMPIAIITCIVVTLVFYVSVSTVSVLSVEPEILGKSNTPLTEVLKHNQSAIPPLAMTLISLIAVVNGALVQIIMASRVIYGMAGMKHAPTFFRKVSIRTRTPIRATLFVVGFVLILALFIDLTTLAKATSAIILFVFISINAALVKIKRTEKIAPEGVPIYPIWLPYLGAVSSVAMLVIGIYTYDW